MIENVERYFQKWDLLRSSDTQDEYGGIVQSYEKVAEIQGRMRPMSGTYQPEQDRYELTKQTRFYCFPTEIEKGDILSNGIDQYEVKAPLDVMHFGRLMQVECEKRDRQDR